MEYVIVTGACGGIGKATAEKLLNEGLSVCAVDLGLDALKDKFPDSAEIVSGEQIASDNGTPCVYCIASDLSSEDAIKDLVKTIVSTLGPARGLVHCAGFDKLSPLYLSKRKDVEALFNIHVYAAMDLCKNLAKKGNAAEGASIVLISSLSAHEGAMGHTAYAAAKGALEGFLPSAASELAGRGIRLNEVVLGVVQTNMSMGFIGKMDQTQADALNESYPLGLGKPEDAAQMIAYLISEKSSWITGQKYILDGGHSVRKV